MKKISSKSLFTICVLGLSLQAMAGNKDRTGQGGAPELLINPWAQSTGVFGLNTAYVSGVEAMKNNIAGLALVEKTDVGLSYGDYLTGSHISIANGAIAQKVGNAGVIGLNIMSMSFGDITTTTYNNPENAGTYRPQFLNVEVGFAKQFSNHIYAGIAATFISEQITNITATGAAFDAGVQYTTGKRDNFHFGITLRNLGTNMRFNGPGLSINGENPQSSLNFSTTTQYPTDKFELPTYLNIGAAYDIYLDEHHLSSKDSTPSHRLTVMADFTSNSFNNDNIGVGLEYSFRNLFMVRGAYRYESGIGDPTTTTTIYTGFAVGATVQGKLSAKGARVAFDYSFRPTDRPANGVHMFSIRFRR